jgi:hypothetical protein
MNGNHHAPMRNVWIAALVFVGVVGAGLLALLVYLGFGVDLRF